MTYTAAMHNVCACILKKASTCIYTHNVHREYTYICVYYTHVLQTSLTKYIVTEQPSEPYYSLTYRDVFNGHT